MFGSGFTSRSARLWFGFLLVVAFIGLYFSLLQACSFR